MKLITIVWMYLGLFRKHPEYRGRNFNWFVPVRMAYRFWRTL